MISVGIAGGSGYTAGELLRCLRIHPETKIDFVYSTTNAGKLVSVVHEDLYGSSVDIEFTDTTTSNVDVLFLCLGHGKSKAFLEKFPFSEETVVIDLSNDFRLQADAEFLGRKFTYGLVEHNYTNIKSAKNIANPGCFATAIQLAILPLAKEGLLIDDLHVNAITGSTGAGQSFSETSHFSWRNNNVSIYKAFNHQHLGEIGESVLKVQPDFEKEINFIPVRGNFTRGILASIYFKTEASEEKLTAIFSNAYAKSPFVKSLHGNIHLKQVVNTNNCFVSVQKIADKVLITSAIDNLLKGAAGQAIQNMNLIFGLPETTGLEFKANYF